ncbi:MAG TPA: aminopeptidase [Candidatus Corynebacterium avicola]|uniref:Probable cytosol aminopeptidase n=1 Tax=Candidatus Corynebacterium avicola TaxID=2838527 RepID=A0A9D1RM86_9CORY|nr:aminopeptidase [Candidatus Corynebacterium avicola]
MKRIPSLPRRVPEVTVGDPVDGGDVIDCRVVVGEVPGTGARVVLADDGVWEVTVPEQPVALTDLTDLDLEPRLGDDGWRAAGAVLMRRLGTLVAGHPVRAKRHTVQIALPVSTTTMNLRNLAQGLMLGSRRITVRKKDAAPEVRQVHLNLDGLDPQVTRRAADNVAKGRAQGSATALARDITGLPGSETPLHWWRRQMKALLGDVPGTRVKTHGVSWLQRKGFGGLLATANGGAGGAAGDPDVDGTPGLIELFWDPAAAEGDLTDDQPDVLLVGGAEVAAAVRALAELKGPRKVVGVIPVFGRSATTGVPVVAGAAEPGCSGYSVVEHVNGLTTQVPYAATPPQQTQAARRLALADAVAYGVKRHQPRRVVVVGPVSAASKSALGERTGAVFGPEQAVRRVTLRGARVGERWWPMPTPGWLESAVNGKVTDLTVRPDGPDAVTAAMFLRRFAGEVPCTVLDISGPVRSESVSGDIDRGSTGFAARTLVEWFRK